VGPCDLPGASGGGALLQSGGGAALFDPSKYADHDVQLEFLEQELRPYPQLASPFLPALSIIDVMMFNSVDEIRGMLNDVRLLRASASAGSRRGT
jgi:hypothetical protein